MTLTATAVAVRPGTVSLKCPFQGMFHGFVTGRKDRSIHMRFDEHRIRYEVRVKHEDKDLE